ncbi:nucleotidyl transferase AbiEii/AbiGii toxin family protein, partial [Candidatus Woesearchaeota archaeon]|nr:nucleotidyl transferase AbiEii/AbiGii toxin family protein [Candidatus Woesearchaeota archaeon]
FKGGTAIQLTILDHVRISEDIDFTIDKPVKDIQKKIELAIDDSKIFGKVTRDKDVDKFIRLIVPYKSVLGNDIIFIDLNERGKLFLATEHLKLKHFYPNIPEFSFPCLNKEEMVAEKVAAAIGRNKPRDHFDIYQLIKHKIPINMSLVRKKCKQTDIDASIIKMFNKAKKLYKRWNEDMLPLIVKEVTFQEVMQTLAEYFNLKEEKDKLKRLD